MFFLIREWPEGLKPLNRNETPIKKNIKYGSLLAMLQKFLEIVSLIKVTNQLLASEIWYQSESKKFSEQKSWQKTTLGWEIVSIANYTFLQVSTSHSELRSYTSSWKLRCCFNYNNSFTSHLGSKSLISFRKVPKISVYLLTL